MINILFYLLESVLEKDKFLFISHLKVLRIMNYSSNNFLTTKPVIILLNTYLFKNKLLHKSQRIHIISEFIDTKMTSKIQSYHIREIK